MCLFFLSQQRKSEKMCAVVVFASQKKSLIKIRFDVHFSFTIHRCGISKRTAWMNGSKTRNRHECRNQISFALHLCGSHHSELINENIFEWTKIKKTDCDSKKETAQPINWKTNSLHLKKQRQQQHQHWFTATINEQQQNDITKSGRSKKHQETNNRFGYRVLRIGVAFGPFVNQLDSKMDFNDDRQQSNREKTIPIKSSVSAFSLLTS